MFRRPSVVVVSSVLALVLSQVSLATPASSITVRSFQDQSDHSAVSFGSNQVAFSQSDSVIAVATLPPKDSALTTLSFPATAGDCTGDRVSKPLWLDNGQGIMTCGQTAYLFDAATGAVSPFHGDSATVTGAGASEGVLWSDYGQVILLKEADGVYAGFGWEGAASATTYLQIDTRHMTLSEENLNGRQSPWGAGSAFWVPAIPVGDGDKGAIFVMGSRTAAPTLVQLDRQSFATKTLATLPTAFGSSSHYSPILLDQHRAAVVETMNDNFSFQGRVMIANLDTGAVNTLSGTDFFGTLLSIDGLRFDARSQLLTMTGQKFTGCLGTCILMLPVAYTLDLKNGGQVAEHDPLHPFPVLAENGEPRMYDGDTEGYEPYFDAYRWAFDSAGDPVLFRTWGKQPADKAFSEVETFFPQFGISRVKSTFPDFDYCALEIPVSGGRILRAGGYINSWHNFCSATFDPVITLKDSKTGELTVLPEQFKTAIEYSAEEMDVLVGPPDCSRITTPRLISSDGTHIQLKIGDEVLSIDLKLADQSIDGQGEE